MHCLQWAQIVLNHTRRSFASVLSRYESRPPWWFMYDTTELLSERISTWWRIDRSDTLLAFIGSWFAAPTPLRTTGRMWVCPRTALPISCWKHLSWQPFFCAPCLGSRLALAKRGPSKGPGLIHRPESLLRGESSHPELDGSHVKQTQL